MFSDFIFHHIGIATHSIEDTAQFYIEAGYSMSILVKDDIQNVTVCFLDKKDMPCIELVQPLSNLSPVSKIIEKSGVTPYHFCYVVKEIDSSIINLKKYKFISISHPVPAIAFANKKICFLFNKNFGLIELLEK
jgi:methylmalonyl-CoA/ethylmalonyl-CoA epimerase